MAMFVIVRSAVPTFDMLIVCEVVVPTTTFPNAIGEGLTDTAAPPTEALPDLELPVRATQPADPSKPRRAKTVTKPRRPDRLDSPRRDLFS